VAANPHLDDCRRMPFFLVFDLWKPSKLTGDSTLRGRATVE
jgi:hypothetical protein